jgi:hypothetical protein
MPFGNIVFTVILGYILAPRKIAPCHMETRALPVEAGEFKQRHNLPKPGLK